MGRLSFAEGDSSVNGTVRQPEGNEVGRSHEREVSATTVDDAVRRLNLDRVDFIKLNIEGSER